MNHNFRENYFFDEHGRELPGDEGYRLKAAAVAAYLLDLKNSSPKNVNIRIAHDGRLTNYVNISYLRWDEGTNKFIFSQNNQEMSYTAEEIDNIEDAVVGPSQGGKRSSRKMNKRGGKKSVSQKKRKSRRNRNYRRKY